MMLWLLCANQQRLSVGGCFYQAFVIIMIASAALTSKKKNPFTIHYLPNNGFMLQKKSLRNTKADFWWFQSMNN